MHHHSRNRQRLTSCFCRVRRKRVGFEEVVPNCSELKSFARPRSLIASLAANARSGSDPSMSLDQVPPLSELKDEGYDSFNSFPIGGVLSGELSAHQFFLLAQFDPEAYEHEDKSDHSRDVPLLHFCCDDHGK